MGTEKRSRGRSWSGLVASLGFLVGSVALGGCDKDANSPAAEPEIKQLEARSAAVLAERTDVRVSVAGEAICRGCTRSEVASLLRVAPRKPFPKDSVDSMWPAKLVRAHSQPDLTRYRWLVKFVDEAKVRLGATGLPMRQQKVAMPEIEGLLQTHGVQMSRAIPTPDEELDALAIRAMRRSLRAQPDLAGIYQVDGEFANKDAFLAFGEALNKLDIVEYVEIEDLQVPPPGDIPPETPDFSNRQGYLYEKSGGVGAPYAWELGIFGQGIKVSDCEFSWDVKHEEFTDGNTLHVEKGQTLTSSFMDHGTAVMGVTVASHEGFGVKGIAPKSEAWVFPEKSQQSSSRRLAAVTNAIKQSGKGDIVMLEMQMTGPGGGYGPAEVTKSVWSATKTGTDAGVVVIGAAGNGSQNLDSSAYSSYRSWGDSGLIMVGAGSNSTKHSKLGFSTYGKRVDVQGWGTGVFTTGYGSFKRIGGDSHQSYSNSFNGTSSATPTVVGAALLIQSHAKENLGKPYTPAELRKLLKDTGFKQGGGQHIGPLPSVRKAIEAISEPEKNKPKVEITKPDDSVKGKTDPKDGGENVFELRVEVDASDDSRIREVYIQVDGDKVGDSDKEEPYVFDLQLEPGKYKVTAVAVDRYGNKATSDDLSVRVSDGSGSGSSGSESPEPGESDPSQDSKGEDDDSEGSDSSEESEVPGDDSEDSGSEDDGDSDGDESKTDKSAGGDEDDKRGGCRAQANAPLSAAWMGLATLGLLGLRRRKS